MARKNSYAKQGNRDVQGKGLYGSELQISLYPAGQPASELAIPTRFGGIGRCGEDYLLSSRNPTGFGKGHPIHKRRFWKL